MFQKKQNRFFHFPKHMAVLHFDILEVFIETQVDIVDYFPYIYTENSLLRLAQLNSILRKNARITLC